MTKGGKVVLEGAVYKTNNYSMFRNNDLQREHHSNTQPYAGLESSLLAYGWWITEPMIVYPMGKDNKHEIVKCHNKFEIAKKHNLYVYYQIDPLRIPIWKREGGKASKGTKWSKKNFVQSWLKKGGNPSFMQLNNFMTKTGVSMSSAVYLFSLSQVKDHPMNMAGVWDTIEDGTYAILDSSFAEEIGNLVIYCRELGIPLAAKDKFVYALALLIRAKVATTKELAKRIHRNRSLLQRKVTVTDYQSLLQEVVNRGFTPRIDVKNAITNYMENERRERIKLMNERKMEKRDARHD
jgi:hypothetical protein